MKLDKVNIVFRTDASSQIGTGHLSRCLTLAKALKKDGASITFICQKLTTALKEVIFDQGFVVKELVYERNNHLLDELNHASWLGTSQREDAVATTKLLEREVIDWVIVDHYALDFRWHNLIKPYVKKIMVIDDIADRKHNCDILLDQNYYKNMQLRYKEITSAHTRLLLGPQFSLLRDEFKSARNVCRAKNGQVKRVLVNFGGVDAENYTAKAIKALASLTQYTYAVDVVIGAQHPDIESIKMLCNTNSYNCHIQTNKMAELMLNADLAVGAGGATTWERCALGLPSIVVPIAENQVDLVESAAILGVIHHMSSKANFIQSLANSIKLMVDNQALRIKMSESAMQLVDAKGADRVVNAIYLQSLTLKLATMDYLERLHEWRNHPDIRRVSSSEEVIPFKVHEAWYERALHDPNKYILIATLGDEDIGVLRFDVDNKIAEISIYLVPGIKSSSGVGTEMLKQGEEWLASNTAVKTIKALVLAKNKLSANFFIKNNFKHDQGTYYKEVTY